MEHYEITNEKNEVLMHSCNWNKTMYAIDKLRTKENIILLINHENKILFKKTNKTYLKELIDLIRG